MTTMTANNAAVFSNNPFLLHPEHVVFVNGSGKKLSESPFYALMAVMVTLLLGCGVFTVVSLDRKQADLAEALEQRGILTTATIVDRRTQADKSISHFITYAFTVESSDGTTATYQREQYVPKAIYERGIGAPLEVRFLPDDPSISRFNPHKPDYGMTLIFGGAFLAMLGLSGLFIWDYLSKKRLAESGKLIEGQFLSCQLSSVKNNFQMKTVYTFQSPSGKSIMGKQTDICNHMRGQLLPEVGTPVAVLYVNDHLYKML